MQYGFQKPLLAFSASALLLMHICTMPPAEADDLRTLFGLRSPIEQLAHDIDSTQAKIDRLGTVTVKQPDIWGESRLTKHRQLYEETMGAEAKSFDDTIQADFRRSDNAFLINAFALQAALGPGIDAAPQNEATRPDKGFAEEVPKTDLTSATAVGRVDNSDNTTIQGVALEPIVSLNQRSRYLQHLNQLRRINEGDDTADTPGYSLNLMRFPVSILPGTKTREGYGAEVTFTITPRISSELLGQSLRTLVINDLLDVLTYPVLKYVESNKKYKEGATKLQEAVTKAAAEPASTLEEREQKTARIIATIRQQQVALRQQQQYSINTPYGAAILGLTEGLDNIPDNLDVTELETRVNTEIENGQSKLEKAVTTNSDASLQPQGRSGQLLITASQLRGLLGDGSIKAIGDKYAAVTDGEVHHQDVRAFLSEELHHTWGYLATESRKSEVNRWDLYCRGLYSELHLEELTPRRDRVKTEMFKGSNDPDSKFKHVLIWSIFVGSAILDHHFHEDMRRVASEKRLSWPVESVHFWGATPDATATSHFREYLCSRWPIQVFAIDPDTQDQNVADSFSQRQTMQLSLALSVASGKLNAQNYTEYARQLQTELDTISLNRSVVGFTHGNDTFGWRFQPRMQAPPTESNVRTIFHDLIIGGDSRDRQIRMQMLEPGPRECVAVVVGPSLLNQIDVDIRTNWFRLDKPHSREFGLEDSVRLGRDVMQLKHQTTTLQTRRHQYRTADLWRLQKAVHQLERQLSMQNAIVDVPTENSVGGVQLLQGGRTSLGPTLIGFYGEPGVQIREDNTNADSASATTLFIVGRNFSVASTYVVAGGQKLPSESVEVISREILQVTIPSVSTNQTIAPQPPGEGRVIDLHVGTPYGVSQHLRIPVVQTAEKPARSSATTAEIVKKNLDEAIVEKYQWSDDTHLNGVVQVDMKVDGKKNNAGPVTISIDSDTQSEKELKILGNARLKGLFTSLDSTTAELAFRVAAKTPEKVIKTIPVGSWNTKISDGGQVYLVEKGNNPPPELTVMRIQKKLISAIESQLTRDEVPSELVLEGYIRIPQAKSGLHSVHRVGGEIVIRLTRKQE